MKLADEGMKLLKKGYNLTRPKWQGYSIYIDKNIKNNTDMFFMTDNDEYRELYMLLPEDIKAKDWQVKRL